MDFIKVMKTYIRELDFVSIRDLVKEILVYYLKRWEFDFSLS